MTAWLGTGALAQAVERGGSRTKQDQLVAATPGGAHPQSTLTPDQALAQLMEGNQRFVARRQSNPHQDFARLTEVATGQAPFAAILGCADSRVVPEIAFDQGIGDLFVVRVAGNIAITEDIASEEYAVGVLGAPLLMVLGHERCGAVAAALEGGELPGVIESLAIAIRPAVQSSEGEAGDRLTNAVKANVRLQVERLQTSSVIAAAVQEGTLKVVGAYYDLDTGEISLVS
ncbi:carbonic anhydrase [Pseudanabaena sp. FACHB-2040]|uniref:carbonic anhydrase n=1 Tax=Pseudanabaena sp. FACHB-2040 TaxID=2692859 RepID=UPI001F54BDFB|nr:carbonic anhydrase [Pseudanabaena sp. FACHB-2040]